MLLGERGKGFFYLLSRLTSCRCGELPASESVLSCYWPSLRSSPTPGHSMAGGGTMVSAMQVLGPELEAPTDKAECPSLVDVEAYLQFRAGIAYPPPTADKRVAAVLPLHHHSGPPGCSNRFALRGGPGRLRPGDLVRDHCPSPSISSRSSRSRSRAVDRHDRLKQGKGLTSRTSKTFLGGLGRLGLLSSRSRDRPGSSLRAEGR